MLANRAETREPSAHEDPRISMCSTFQDDVWDFTSEINRPDLNNSETTIYWKFQITSERDSFDSAYSSILLTLKQLAYAMLFQANPRKCRTVVALTCRLKRFVRFLSAREKPIYRFQDVLESDVESYIDDMKLRCSRSNGLSPAALACELRALNKLYEYKEHLSDHMRFRATKDKTPSQAAGHRCTERNRTQAIPDTDLNELINVCLSYIQELAPHIFECLEEYNLFAENVRSRSFKFSGDKSKFIEDNFFSKQEVFHTGKELNSALIRLRTACFIILTFCTGMRISEVLASRRGSIRQEADVNHGVFYWIDSLLYKTQKNNSGSPRSWMCGRLGAQAVAVLEKLGELLGAHARTPYLFFAFQHFSIVDRTKHRQVIKCLANKTLRVELKDFCTYHHINIDLHSHRLRRSFARNIIRYSSTSILALKEHLKHWSLYMTDWYIGMDQELIEDLEAERLLLSIEAMEKICTQPAGGAGGRRWARELEQRIAEGKLPREFRGKAGAEFRKEMINSLHDSGMIVIPCSSFTHCIFQKDRALCTTGDMPVLHRCNPYDCSNSYILPENIPYYRKKLAMIQVLYAGLSGEEQKSPVGLLYSREMLKIRRSLEPFTNE